MKFVGVSVIFLTVFLAHFTFAQIVQTQYGPVLGTTRMTETGQTYFSFQGIPYAHPPDGILRFKDPIPPFPWIEPLNCTVEGPIFWGVHEVTGQIEGSFDSLHVNIFSNNIYAYPPYPVMVFIHGGAYRSGSGSTAFYGPDYLVEHNVTYVTINYRLGAFGFLTLDDETLNVPGNAGMKDQRMALRWVQQNIRHFGGDHNRVLLFGHSAGGSSVHFHMMSESSKGLFHRGYATGSNALQNTQYAPRRQWAQRLAARLGFHSSNETELLKFLEAANPVDIVREQANLHDLATTLREGFFQPFGPLRELYMTPGAFLTEDFSELLQNSWGNNIEFVIGAVSGENLPALFLIRNDKQLRDMIFEFENYIPREANVERNTTQSRKCAQMIKDLYYPVLEATNTNVDGIIYLGSDMDMWFGIHRSVRYRMQAGNLAPTFVMRFDANTENSVFKRMLNALAPEFELYTYPIHGDEFSHFFKHVHSVPRVNMSVEGESVLRFMTTSLVNFASTGNPSVPQMNITWTPVQNKTNLLYGLNIHESNTRMTILPEARRMGVFDEIMALNAQTSAASRLSHVLTYLAIIGYFVQLLVTF